MSSDINTNSKNINSKKYLSHFSEAAVNFLKYVKYPGNDNILAELV